MSTKNLARAAIEGAATNTARLRSADVAEDDWVAPRLRRLGRHFRDELSAPARWLDAQVGDRFPAGSGRATISMRRSR